LLAQIELPVGAGIVGDVIAEARPVRLEDPRSDPRYLPQVDALTGLETRSVVTVPLLARGSVLGALQIVNRRDGGAFDQFTGATVTPRAVVKAVRNALVYFAAHRDALFADGAARGPDRQ
jgi:signal transduction protein with GAF and PtsI domain